MRTEIPKEIGLARETSKRDLSFSKNYERPDLKDEPLQHKHSLNEINLDAIGYDRIKERLADPARS